MQHLNIFKALRWTINKGLESNTIHGNPNQFVSCSKRRAVQHADSAAMHQAEPDVLVLPESLHGKTYCLKSGFCSWKRQRLLQRVPSRHHHEKERSWRTCENLSRQQQCANCSCALILIMLDTAVTAAKPSYP